MKRVLVLVSALALFQGVGAVEKPKTHKDIVNAYVRQKAHEHLINRLAPIKPAAPSGGVRRAATHGKPLPLDIHLPHMPVGVGPIDWCGSQKLNCLHNCQSVGGRLDVCPSSCHSVYVSCLEDGIKEQECNHQAAMLKAAQERASWSRAAVTLAHKLFKMLNKSHTASLNSLHEASVSYDNNCPMHLPEGGVGPVAE